MLKQTSIKFDKLYFLGMFLLILSLSLLVYSVFLFPHLLLGWHYHIPEFISTWQNWLNTNYSLSESYINCIILAVFFIPAVIVGLVGNKISHKVENAENHLLSEEPIILKEKKSSEGFDFFLKILLLILVVYAATRVFEWLIEDNRPKPTKVIPKQIITKPIGS